MIIESKRGDLMGNVKKIVGVLLCSICLFTSISVCFANNQTNEFFGERWDGKIDSTKENEQFGVNPLGDSNFSLADKTDENGNSIVIKDPAKLSTSGVIGNAINLVTTPFQTVLTIFYKTLLTFYMDQLKNQGVELDTLIYNKSPDYSLSETVKTDSNLQKYREQTGQISLFYLNFNKNTTSVFARIAMKIYTFTSALAIIFMFIMLSLIGLKAFFSTVTTTKIELKETLVNYLLSFSLILLFPRLFQGVIYLCNLMTASFRPGYAMFELFTGNFDNLGDCLLGIAYFVLLLYFIFAYGTRAGYLLICYAFFPIMALTMNSAKARRNFDMYISDTLSLLLIQPVDAVIFFSYSFLIPYCSFLVQVILMASIIPIRKFTRKYTGVFSQGSAISDMGGFMAVQSVLGIAKGLVGVGVMAGTGIASGFADLGLAKQGLGDSVGNNPLKQSGYAPESRGSSNNELVPVNGVTDSARSNVSSLYGTNPIDSTEKASGGSGSASPYRNLPKDIDINKFGIREPQTASQASEVLRHRGKSKIMSAALQLGATGMGTALGVVAGIPLGAQGMAVGGNIGMTMGQGIGNLASGVDNELFSLYTPGYSEQLQEDVNDKVIEKAKEEQQNKLAVSNSNASMSDISVENEGSSSSRIEPNTVVAKLSSTNSTAIGNPHPVEVGVVMEQMSNFANKDESGRLNIIGEHESRMNEPAKNEFHNQIHEYIEPKVNEYCNNNRIPDSDRKDVYNAYSTAALSTGYMLNLAAPYTNSNNKIADEAISRQSNQYINKFESEKLAKLDTLREERARNNRPNFNSIA